MNCRSVVVITFSVLMVLLSMVNTQAQPSTATRQTLPQWKYITASSIELAYHPLDEDFACQLLPQLVEATQEAQREGQVTQASLKQMDAQKTKMLRFIAAAIGLPKPGREMTCLYEDILHINSDDYHLLSNSHRFQLWNSDLLVTALRNGEHIPGIMYNGAKNQISLDLRTRCSRGKNMVFPIMYQQGDTVDDVAARMYSFMMMLAKGNDPLVIFHEAAESGIVNDFGIDSAYRRWFCDGIAQYVAEQTVHEFFGQEAYTQVASMYDPNTCTPLMPQVDLLAWRAAEYDAMPDTPRDTLVVAHYYFALQEIRGLADRYGTDVITKVMRQLAKTPRAQRDSCAIFAAIRTVTGEDMATKLSVYGKEANQDFRGVAICDIKYTLVKGKQIKSCKLSDGSQVMLDGRQDILVDFQYGILSDPVTIQVVLGNGTWSHSYDIILDGRNSHTSFYLDLPRYSQEIPEGTYTICLMLRKKALAEKISVVLVKP